MAHTIVCLCSHECVPLCVCVCVCVCLRGAHDCVSLLAHTPVHVCGGVRTCKGEEGVYKRWPLKMPLLKEFYEDWWKNSLKFTFIYSIIIMSRILDTYMYHISRIFNTYMYHASHT